MSRGKVCIPVAARTAAEMAEKVRRAERLADVIELRFDGLDASEVDKAVAIESSKPLLATFRPLEQGGLRRLTFDERSRFWTRNLSRFWAIDIEDDLLAADLDNPQIIASYHNFENVPDDLTSIAERLFASPASIVKIAVTAKDITDTIAVWKLFDLAKRHDKQLIPIAMGESGKWTCVLGLAHGAPLTYASIESAEQTAEGQITADKMLEVYRVRERDENTRVYGVIGDPVTASRSPGMHNAAFKHAGLNAVFLRLQAEDVDAFFARMVKSQTREIDLNFAGFSVTMPHKQSVMRYLDEIDPVAKAVGAVNTIKVDGEKLIGYNTDVHGFITSLKRAVPHLAGARVALFGAGGGARACAFALKREGPKITVFGRNPEKGQTFANEFGTGFARMTDNRPLKTDIVINATPVGMPGNDGTLPVSEDGLAGVRLVYDLVTRESDTPLIAMAKRLGIQTITGFEMLVEQGAKQFEIWTGEKAPIDVMRAAAK